MRYELSFKSSQDDTIFTHFEVDSICATISGSEWPVPVSCLLCRCGFDGDSFVLFVLERVESGSFRVLTDTLTSAFNGIAASWRSSSSTSLC